MNRMRRALIAAVLTGVLRIGSAASPDNPPPQNLHAPVADSSARAATPFTLTRDQAIGRTLDKHPDLKLFEFTEKTLQADADIAAQRPPLVAGPRMQNALGTHETTGFKNAEIALTRRREVMIEVAIYDKLRVRHVSEHPSAPSVPMLSPTVIEYLIKSRDRALINTW